MKITIVGAAGGIGQPLALLINNRLGGSDELALYDVNPVVKGIAADLSHIPSQDGHQVIGYTEAAAAFTGADVVLVASSVSNITHMGVDHRGSLFTSNASMVADITEDIARYCKTAHILLVSNPVNSLLPVVAGVMEKEGCLDRRKLFGVTTLDLFRARQFMNELTGKYTKILDIPVVGGHSEATTVPLISQSPYGTSLTDAQVCELTERIKNGYNEVISTKNASATLSMAQATFNFVEAFIDLYHDDADDANFSTTAYVVSDNRYTSFFSQELKANRDGVMYPIAPLSDLTDFEKEELGVAIHQLQVDIDRGDKFVKDYV